MIASKFKFYRITYAILHVVVLLMSIFLVVGISVDTFKNIAYYQQPEFMEIQTWICLFFLVDFVIEFIMSDRKRHYLWTHIIFFVVSIPYESIIAHWDLTLSPTISYIMRFIPLIRGGYALAIVVGWFTSNKIAGLLITYTLNLMSTVYFVSMVFYIVERHVNSGIESYTDALWWACMEMTTTGSDIYAVTPLGRFLGFAISCLGMMALPLFTVYISSVISRRTSILDTKLDISHSSDKVDKSTKSDKNACTQRYN